MPTTSVTVTRDSYTVIASPEFGTGAPINVTVLLPMLPFRVANVDRVELLTASSAPTVPADPSKPVDASIVLENSTVPNAMNAMSGINVRSGENLYARWLGHHEYKNASDLFVVIL